MKVIWRKSIGVLRHGQLLHMQHIVGMPVPIREADGGVYLEYAKAPLFFTAADFQAFVADGSFELVPDTYQFAQDSSAATSPPLYPKSRH
jgi:hypothetical protein